MLASSISRPQGISAAPVRKAQVLAQPYKSAPQYMRKSIRVYSVSPEGAQNTQQVGDPSNGDPSNKKVGAFVTKKEHQDFFVCLALFYVAATMVWPYVPALVKAVRAHPQLAQLALGAGVLLLEFRSTIGKIIRFPEQVTAAAQVQSDIAASDDQVKLFRSELAQLTLDLERHIQQQAQNSRELQERSDAQQHEFNKWRDGVRADIAAKLRKQRELENSYAVYQRRMQPAPPSGLLGADS